jgi:hypothetical protein
MMRSLITLVVCTFGASAAHAQQIPTPSQIFATCGQIRTGNDAHQFGHYGLWMEYIVWTARDVNLCPITVEVEAHVPGVEGSGLTDSGAFSASVRRQVPVPYPGRWQSSGRHGFVFWVPAVPLPIPWSNELAPTATVATVEAARLEEGVADVMCDLAVEFENGQCDYANSPLIVDTARDGYRLTSVENGVRFDLNADGVPEQVAWTGRDSDDAFLALDRNGNGRIDDGSELFGNHTPARPDTPEVTTPNGFEALKFLESAVYGLSERNGIIDARDAAFARLLLWRDLNHNGLSESEELQPVSESGLEVIHTEYKNSRRVDKHGNEFRQRSRVRWADGQYDQIFDVWLVWRD